MKKILVIATTIGFLSISFFSVNRFSGQSKAMLDLQEEKSLLQKEVSQLELKLSEKNSLSLLEQKAISLGMGKAESFWYVDNSEAFASR